MTSEVYARKWRPSVFADLVGQEHITSVLQNALTTNRLGHAYIFCGPRGTGKTTTARILAKAANCLALSDGDPCNSCTICISANSNTLLDIIELDAASNRGIDEIREIRDKVNFAAIEGKYKIYIIDEAHMLTDQASNAFLKTLEEPPPHVIFILCTTEAHRILPTILSRCQRHDFRRLQNQDMINQLASIASKEKFSIDSEALKTISRQSFGSLRDAENLLEQIVISYGNDITNDHVTDMLGLITTETPLNILSALLAKQTTQCLSLINEASWEGFEPKRIHKATLDLLRAAMLIEWGVVGNLDLPETTINQITASINKIPSHNIGQALKIWSTIVISSDSASTLALELAAIEICGASDELSIGLAQPINKGKMPSIEQESEKPRQVPSFSETVQNSQRANPVNNEEPDPSTGISDTNTPEVQDSQFINSMHTENPKRYEDIPAPDTQEAPIPIPDMEKDSISESKVTNDFRNSWMECLKILSRCKGTKYTLGALLRDCSVDDMQIADDSMDLPFRNQANLDRMREEMADPNSRKMVHEAIYKCFGHELNLELTLCDSQEDQISRRAIQDSPLVRAALGMGARIIEETQE